MKAIAGLDYGVSGTGYIGVGFYTGSTLTDAQNLTFDMAGAASAADVITNAESAINTYASGHSYTLSEGIVWTVPVVKSLVNAPQAAIADAPTDAVTNYNTVTTLLGALTGAVNTANTKQNDIATKLNTMKSELVTLGLISA